jgi:hypothetical protein
MHNNALYNVFILLKTHLLSETTDSTGKGQGHINLDIFRKLKAIYIKIANHKNHPPEQQIAAY